MLCMLTQPVGYETTINNRRCYSSTAFGQHTEPFLQQLNAAAYMHTTLEKMYTLVAGVGVLSIITAVCKCLHTSSHRECKIGVPSMSRHRLRLVACKLSHRLERY